MVASQTVGRWTGEVIADDGDTRSETTTQVNTGAYLPTTESKVTVMDKNLGAIGNETKTAVDEEANADVKDVAVTGAIREPKLRGRAVRDCADLGTPPGPIAADSSEVTATVPTSHTGGQRVGFTPGRANNTKGGGVRSPEGVIVLDSSSDESDKEDFPVLHNDSAIAASVESEGSSESAPSPDNVDIAKDTKAATATESGDDAAKETMAMTAGETEILDSTDGSTKTITADVGDAKVPAIERTEIDVANAVMESAIRGPEVQDTAGRVTKTRTDVPKEVERVAAVAKNPDTKVLIDVDTRYASSGEISGCDTRSSKRPALTGANASVTPAKRRAVRTAVVVPAEDPDSLLEPSSIEDCQPPRFLRALRTSQSRSSSPSISSQGGALPEIGEVDVGYSGNGGLRRSLHQNRSSGNQRPHPNSKRRSRRS